ncbi:MAG: succinate dehydrogenase, hydrophobic membrane anchor protein [Pseudomonadota bacterium]
MKFVNPVALARGHGSAKSGVEHWWAQRITSVALAPLTLWVIYALATLGGASYDEVIAWMSNPFNGALLIAWVVTMLHHAQLGLQVVIEDYIHVAWQEYTLLIGVKLLAALGAIVATVSVLSVVFGG